MAYRIMFLIIAASLAALLLNAGGTINSIAAIIVASGARPLYQAISRESIAKGIAHAADIIRGRSESS